MSVKNYEEIEEVEGYPKIPIGKAKDLRGQLFGKWVPLYRTINKGKSSAWVCECSCENKTKKAVSTSNLVRSQSKSCGCFRNERISKSNIIDLTGETFGRLTVLEKTNQRICGGVVWKCRCNCKDSTIVYVLSSNLTSGSTQSCGCLFKEISSKVHTKDLKGEVFGRLTVLEKTNRRSKGNNIIWKCRCNCKNKNIVYVSSDNLRSGSVQSCGCLKSKGEAKIKEILAINKVNYISQAKFDSCRFNDTKAYAKFDFSLVGLKCLIEFDGIGHYQKVMNWDFNKQKEHDEFKNQWCRDNGYILIRIPYLHYNGLCIEDLMPNTSKFRVV